MDKDPHTAFFCHMDAIPLARRNSTWPLPRKSSGQWRPYKSSHTATRSESDLTGSYSFPSEPLCPILVSISAVPDFTACWGES